jgi:ubiquinone/menaquinone biosynthesis C-methylase UbiE
MGDRNRKLADLAAGTGWLAQELAAKARKVYGVDISPNMILLSYLVAKKE